MSRRSVYLYVLMLISVFGLTAAASVQATVVQITSPTEGQLLGDATPVTGYASCASFHHWQLEYKASGASTWVPLGLSFFAATVETQFANWDTSDLPQGDYDLRLQVYDTGGLAGQTITTVDMTYVPCGDIDGDLDVDEDDLTYLADWMFQSGPAPFQIRAADVNADGSVDVSDALYLVDYFYDCGMPPMCTQCGDIDGDGTPEADDVYALSAYMFSGGPAPWPLRCADVDGSGQVDISDLVYLVDYWNGSGEPLLCYYLVGDVDNSGLVDISDLLDLADYVTYSTPVPVPLLSGDLDSDGDVDQDDLDCLVDYMFNGGPCSCAGGGGKAMQPAGMPAATGPELLANSPNPFNPKTMISFNVPDDRPVTLRIHDVSGRLVRTLADGQVFGSGLHTLEWDGRDNAGTSVAAGVYLYRMTAGDFAFARKMMLVK